MGSVISVRRSGGRAGPPQRSLGVEFCDALPVIHYQVVRIQTLLLLAVALSVAPGLRGADPAEPPPLPEPQGTILEASSQDWQRIPVPGTGCTLINNVWNKGASGAALQQQVFLEEVDEGRPAAGWRWSSPRRFPAVVVSQPQVVCGDKPWDAPVHLRPDFPFRVGSQSVRADFKASVRATGVYNLAFTMWAAASNRPAKTDITSGAVSMNGT
jgi:hypothetical protein